jgi:2-(1,2-epoxy-1,2-dihydrophenyl)acetyl-CoA isomerase
MTDFETIVYEADAGVGRLTLNRPEQLNGITNLMLREMYAALRVAATDDTLRVLVLTGAGRAFCPGADLAHYTGPNKPPPDSRDRSPELFRVATLLHEIPAVTLAAINGACAGAGLGWACACDLRVAAASAKFNTAFLGVAIAGDMGLPWTLQRLVGSARARELSFLRGKFDAAEAERLGLLSQVFDDAVFRKEVDRIVDRVAAYSPLALRTLKLNHLAAERMSFADFVDIEAERHLRVSVSPETSQAFEAFMNKGSADSARDDR